MLLEAGLAVDEQGLSNARWLMEHDLPLTAENLIYKQELDGLSADLSPEHQSLPVSPGYPHWLIDLSDNPLKDGFLKHVPPSP